MRLILISRRRVTVRPVRLALLLSCVLMPLLVAPAVARPSSLPVVTVETHERIRISGEKVNATVALPGFQGAAAINVRGRWSRRYPKNAYRVELRDARGKNLDASLLGMPAEDDWILYAAYDDRTLMRNVLAYDTARWMGRYAARTRYVEVRLNGAYQGVYVLMENLKLHRERVVEREGGFLLEWTSPGQAARKDPSFRTPVTRRPIVWEDPEREDLTGPQARRIRDMVGRVDRLIETGPRGSWRRHLDARAAVDYFLVNELFKNQDALVASTYLSGSPGRALRFGPVWDFDLAMGAARSGPGTRVSGWMLANRPWARQLYADRAFARAMHRRWRALRRDGLREQLFSQTAAYARALAPAAARDNVRWPSGGDRPRGSTRRHVLVLRRWLRVRVAWLDANLPQLARQQEARNRRAAARKA